ncbi:MAG: hypothetical protein LQ338_006297 [Usnochroma carphineum]|nr:MAG: hypothetical protein LQ338_006297 [Usnochroma carphineum]
MTLFKKYNAQRLKTLEWRYHIMCYGLPFVVALVYLFIDIPPRGKIYGPASLWCWVSIEWVALRIALVYGPAWIAIFASFTLYAISGLEIFKKRQQLRAFHHGPRYPVEVENPFTGFKTTEVEITHEPAKLSYYNKPGTNSIFIHPDSGHKRQSPPSKGYDQYSVKISSTPIDPTSGTPIPSVPPTPGSAAAITYRNNRAAMEANTAAWGYTKVALLFFVSLLITWVPSSVNRVYSLIHPELVSIPFTYASAVVLPLMGFWNSVIYITTSWGACKDLFFKYFFIARAARIAPLPSVHNIRLRRKRSQDTSSVFMKKSRTGSSRSDSMCGLASRDGGNTV